MISDCVVCPRCRDSLDGSLSCGSCGQSYPRLNSLILLLSEPAAHIEHWRMQLGLIIQQASETNRALHVQAAEPGVTGTTRARLRALGRAIAEQVADVAAVLVPAIGPPQPPHEGVGLPRGAADYISCLFRDWAWSNDQGNENDRSLAAIRRVTQGRGLGRTLVLGAGGCRLAYDLHLQCGGTDTAVVDIDPYLLAFAEAVIRGADVSVTETSANAPEVDPVSRAWTLSAPAGPLGADVFHFLLADGTEPPFADQTFDTVVTPWFIDQIPTDLEALLRRLHGLLVPGGRWINHGPLIYRPDALPIARWYSRQEIFELAGAVGFRIGAWESGPQPHLVSPLTGRGLIENVLTFEALSRCP
jgi:SAM-dependent methyltransferase